MDNPLKPPVALLAKIGSIVGHAEEGLSHDAHQFDFDALCTLIADPEVKAWMQEMRAMALVPLPRNAGRG
jgi:hypothetical protein